MLGFRESLRPTTVSMSLTITVALGISCLPIAATGVVSFPAAPSSMEAAPPAPVVCGAALSASLKLISFSGTDS